MTSRPLESLSGAELDKAPPLKGKNKTTLSSRYMSNTMVRNSNVIQAARHTKHDPQTNSKREELQRRIEETRRQLQCVGHQSNLQSSMSIQDLRGLGYHDTRKTMSQKPAFQVPNIVIDADVSGGIRRACSLSDLSNTPGKLRPVQTNSGVSGKTINLKGNRSTGRHGAQKTSALPRSPSVGTLNQSDSESEQSHGRSQSMRRLTRPTIASQNKVISNQKSGRMPRSRGMTSSYSTMALNKPDNEDSSSEEGKNNRTSHQPRSSSTDRSGSAANASSHSRRPTNLGRSGSEWNLAPSQRSNARTNAKFQRNTGMVRSASNLEDSSAKASYHVDFDNTPVPQLLDKMKTHLSFVLEYTQQMRRRMATEATNAEPGERDAWLTSFQETVSEHMRSMRQLDPLDAPPGLNEALSSLPANSTSSEMFSAVMQHYFNAQKNG